MARSTSPTWLGVPVLAWLGVPVPAWLGVPVHGRVYRCMAGCTGAWQGVMDLSVMDLSLRRLVVVLGHSLVYSVLGCMAIQGPYVYPIHVLHQR